MIEREEALIWLKKYLFDDKLIKHSLAVESIMSSIAKYLNKNEKLWSLVGLLHDLDYEYTKDKPEEHSNQTAELLEGIIPEEGINSIKAHNYIYTKYIPASSLDKILIASDAVSGLIIATALIMPSKKLADVKIETLIKKFNDDSFAKGCDRKKINLCIDIGINTKKFLELTLDSLKKISKTLDL
ncbi:HDIG domain-containing metalloprotein [Thermoplasmatota archaeon]